MGNHILDFLKRLLGHRCLPAALAIGAIVIMLPALRTGLFLDDLPERAIAIQPSRLPPRICETGNPSDSGSFSTVLREFFVSYTPPEWRLKKKYGVFPWWAPDDLRIVLCRPVAAFTHWLDYRLYPDSPPLMHAQNIAWFAGVVLLVAVICRKLIEPSWAAGLAALLFLLDANTYFPVVFVANRGFFMALFFGLMALYEHHRWRSAKSPFAFLLSVLFFGLSLLSEEGGLNTFAFILAYALVLEPGPLRKRVLTVLPAFLVVVTWKIAYEALGFGVHGIAIFVDPSHHPQQFAEVAGPRAIVLLVSQLFALPPELLLGVRPSLETKVVAYCGLALVAVLLVLLPCVRRNKAAAYWFAVMVLAAVPLSSIVPLGKNFGFVAVGAYGLIASFVAGLLARPGRLPQSLAYRVPAWAVCGLLLLMHVPGAIAERIVTVRALAAFAVEGMEKHCGLGNCPDAKNKHVIVINAPCQILPVYGPYYKAYRGQPLPRSMRTLAPGCASFDVQRTGDKTLVVQSRATDLFTCDDVGPLHVAYFVMRLDLWLAGETKFIPGDRQDLGSVTVEILKLGSSGLPSRVAFHFDAPLDSPEFDWMRFDWATGCYEPFEVPPVGESVTVLGPRE